MLGLNYYLGLVVTLSIIDNNELGQVMQPSGMSKGISGLITNVSFAEGSVNEGQQESNGEKIFYKYIGNRSSQKFHRSWCPFEQCMNPKRAQFFLFRKDAIRAGYHPCCYCLPPVGKKVSAKIVGM